jgi:hypothetical protein
MVVAGALPTRGRQAPVARAQSGYAFRSFNRGAEWLDIGQTSQPGTARRLVLGGSAVNG